MGRNCWLNHQAEKILLSRHRVSERASAHTLEAGEGGESGVFLARAYVILGFWAACVFLAGNSMKIALTILKERVF